MIGKPTLAAIFTAFLTVSAHAEFRFQEKDGTHSLYDGDKLISAFRTDYRVPYLYPLTSPSGANISRHWPMENDAPTEEKDHPHHRGLWLSHGDVNGYDFWAGMVGKKDAVIRTDKVETEKSETSVTLTASLTWLGDGKELLREKRYHTFSRPDPKTLVIDIHSSLTAVADKVTFGDTKEGTFAVRTDRTLRVVGKEAKATLTNSNGETNAAAWGRRAKWAAYSGPDELGKPAVVAIIDGAKSFRHPTHWHARDYGLLAANPFGIHDFEKKQDKTLGNHVLNKDEVMFLIYQVVIHEGTLESAKLDGIQPAPEGKFFRVP
ncbi:MAG: hypothetical protein RLZZ505_2442 [Verrucomicrobiota bacterium]|jgi:hypothetical protein